MTPVDLDAVRRSLWGWEGSREHLLASQYLQALLAEVAEHRAARGIEAPAGGLPSREALWERAASARRYVDEEGHTYDDECPDGWTLVSEEADDHWVWRWHLPGGDVRAEGAAETCLGAIAAAEAALVGGGR